MISPADKNALILLRLEQAERCVSDAEFNMADGRFAVSANRVYYGMFYAILALGLLCDYKSSKHQQVIGWFNKNFVHTGLFPQHFTRIVKDAFDARMDADYGVDFDSFDADLKSRLADMKLFIATIKDYLEAQLRQG
jgi:uncharacterized protein (UPF0332 family)